MAAILHLGNVEFSKGKEIDSSVIKDDKSRFHLDMTAELLRYAIFFINHGLPHKSIFVFYMNAYLLMTCTSI